MRQLTRIIGLFCFIIIGLGYFIADISKIHSAETNTDAGDPVPMPKNLQALDHLKLLNQLLFYASARSEAQDILDTIAKSGDIRFVAGLIDTLRYRRPFAAEIGRTLNQLTRQSLPPEWSGWVEWAGKHPEIKSFAAYVLWKAGIFENIDPNFKRFVHSSMKIAPGSRVEEIVWGGVLVDGIPALDNPKMIDPREADYLDPDERVFGVSINGDTRAYPARFLDWHEMFNDVIGGEPVTLAY